jgi:hypothetical protein
MVNEKTRPLVYSSRLAVILQKLKHLSDHSKHLAHAGEIGKTAKHLVNWYGLSLMHGLSISYCLYDVAVKANSVRKNGRDAILYSCIDTTLFHSLASFGLPALTIHSIIKYSGKLLNSNFGYYPKIPKFLPFLIGIGSMPFIISPIDVASEYLLNNSTRKIYMEKIPYIKIESNKINFVTETK